MNFNYMQVSELRQYLKDRNISCTLYNKLHLIRLCEIADELNLEIVGEDDYKVMDMRRRTLQDGSILPEISTVQNWSTDLSSLPEVLHCDILVYFLSSCSWDDKRLRDFKSENGYKLFKARHIDKVQIAPVNGFPYMFVKATCTPETRQSATPYTTWVIIKADGQVHCGGCSCVADNGSCKHCVALLFAMVDFSDRHHDRHTQVGTDVACAWDRPRISSQPMEIDDIILRIDDDEPTHVEPTQANFEPRCTLDTSSHNVEKLVHKLCKSTGAVCNHILCDSSEESSDEELSLPFSVDEIAKTCHSKDDIISTLKIHHDANTNAAKEKLTRGQIHNDNWYKYRKGRITASLFSSVLHCKFTSRPSNYILDRVFMRKSAKSASLEYGRTHESIARQAYTTRYRKTHKKSTVKQCGIFIDKHNPYIGASPDAVVECKCCGKGLLEIKCSYQYRYSEPREACQDKDYHVYLDNEDNVRLKESSPWYVQIQGQLGVTGLDWCDFVLFTKKDFITERIYFDKEFYSTIVNKCEQFFRAYVINEL